MHQSLITDPNGISGWMDEMGWLPLYLRVFQEGWEEKRVQHQTLWRQNPSTDIDRGVLVRFGFGRRELWTLPVARTVRLPRTNVSVFYRPEPL